MGACISKTENSNAVGTADLRAELGMLFRAISQHAPGLSLPSNPQHSVSLTVTPAVDVNPAYANSPSTLALVVSYFRYNVYAPLVYLALVKHHVDDEDCDDDVDDGKPMTMLAPELEEESPLFGAAMSAAELLEEIHKERVLLLEGLAERKSELEEELTSIDKWRRVWSEANSALSILLAVINSAALVAAKVISMPASVAAMLLAFLAAGNLLVAAAVKAVDWCFGITDDECKNQLESQKDGIEAMRQELPLPDLELIRWLLENLKTERAALRALEKEQSSTAPTEEAGQMQAANHLEREVNKKKKKKKTVKKKKKKVKKGIKDVHKIMDRVKREVTKAAADFANIIAK